MIFVMTKEMTTHSAEETQRSAKEFLAHLSDAQPLCLFGELGSGKTTFAQGLLGALGAEKPYASPTFTIVRTYDVDTCLGTHPIRTVHHIDAYRITADDLSQIGWEDMIADPHALVILEWPERIENALPSRYHKISFVAGDGDERRITVAANS